MHVSKCMSTFNFKLHEGMGCLFVCLKCFLHVMLFLKLSDDYMLFADY